LIKTQISAVILLEYVMPYYNDGSIETLHRRAMMTVASHNTIRSLPHVGGAQGKTVLNTISRLVEVINAYEALEMAAKEMWIKRERLRQACAMGTTMINALSRGLVHLQPDEVDLPHGAILARGLPTRELGLTCSVRSLLWHIFNTDLISLEPVSTMPRHI
jgi:hypothetical protein